MIPELFRRQHRLFPKAELYNLAQDIGETTDLSARHPGVVEFLLGEAREFDRALQADKRAPVWLEPIRVPTSPSEGY